MVKRTGFSLMALYFTLILLLAGKGFSLQAQEKKIMIAPYIGKDNSEIMLVWDQVSGKSASWYYDKREKKFKLAGEQFQLPADPGVKDGVMMAPYIGNDHSEVILVWSMASGRSVSWYYDNAAKKFKKATPQFQLPEDVGLKGTIMMQPYKGKDGSEVILVWDYETGRSASWYYDLKAKKYLKATAGFQLPQDPGLGKSIMMRAYIAKDGSEVIYTWSTETGASINWYYDNNKKKYLKSLPKFQLPPEAAMSGKVMMHPFIAKDGSEVVWIWDVNEGKSVNWYFDLGKNVYLKSPDGYQVENVQKNCMLYPYVADDGTEVVLFWNMDTGKSINWYYDNAAKKYLVSEPQFQLPENPL